MTSGLPDAGGTMAGAWDTDPDGGGHWELDLRLTHRRTG
jgi:hypothetical protein